MGFQKGDAALEQVTEVCLLREQHVRVSLQDGTKYYLLRKEYQERPVQVGESIDEKEFAWWVLKHQYRPALDKAVSMLAARACSKGEIQRKLSGKGYSISGDYKTAAYFIKAKVPIFICYCLKGFKGIA